MTINLSRDANELILVMDMERKKKKLKKNFSTVRRIVTSWIATKKFTFSQYKSYDLLGTEGTKIGLE